MKKTIKIFPFLLITGSFVLSQSKNVNYNESQIPVYTLPDSLIMLNGTKVKDKETWLNTKVIIS